MKSIRITSILVRIYMYATIISALLMFQGIDDTLLKVGASSWLLALLISSSWSVNPLIGVCLCLWSILFPVLLVVFYIMARKRLFIPFVAISIADSVVVLIWVIYCWFTGNAYFTGTWLEDAVVSGLYSGALITIASIGRRSTGRQGDGYPVPTSKS